MGTSSIRRITLDSGPLPRSTDLAEHPFAILLARVRAGAMTGTMNVGGAKSIVFQRGAPVDVLSDWPDEITEIYMLREGLIRDNDVAKTREHATSRDEGFAEAMMDLGMLRPSELYEHSTRSAEQRLVSCFGLAKGPVSFEETFEIVASRRAIPLDVVRVIAQGLERYYDPARLDRELAIEAGTVVLPLELDGRPWLGERLNTMDARIRRLTEEHPTLEALVKSLQLPEDEVRRRLYGLFCLGLVGFETTTEARSEKTTVPFVAPVAKPRSVSNWLVERLRPPAHREDAPTEWASVTARRSVPAEHLAATPSSIATGERPGSSPPLRSSTPPPPPPSQSAMRPRPLTPSARSRISTPFPPPRVKTPSRPALRPRDAQREVARLLEEAELARVSGDRARSIVLLRKAQEHQPESPEVLGDLALTLFQEDPRRFAREANVLARQARQGDPALPKPYVVLGMLLEQVMEPSRAVQLYRYALTRDPECAEAQECLDRLGSHISPSA